MIIVLFIPRHFKKDQILRLSVRPTVHPAVLRFRSLSYGLMGDFVVGAKEQLKLISRENVKGQ